MLNHLKTIHFIKSMLIVYLQLNYPMMLNHLFLFTSNNYPLILISMYQYSLNFIIMISFIAFIDLLICFILDYYQIKLRIMKTLHFYLIKLLSFRFLYYQNFMIKIVVLSIILIMI
jgi:hypothetical protein